MFYNVGQGNCTIVKSLSRKVLIVDAGSSNTVGIPDIDDPKYESLARKVADSIRGDVHASKWLWFVVSHPDRDHLNLVKLIIQHLGILRDPNPAALNASKLLSDFNVGIVFGGKPDLYKKEDGGELLGFVRTHSIPHRFSGVDCHRDPTSNSYVLKGDNSPILPDFSPRDGVNVCFLSVGVEALYSRRPREEELTNAASIVMKIQVGPHSAILTGDKTEKETKFIINRLSLAKQEGLLSSDILLATHHGSSKDYVPEWVNLVNPRYVVFSSGRSFDHPRSDTIKGYIDQAQTLAVSPWHFVQFHGDSIDVLPVAATAAGGPASPIVKSIAVEAPSRTESARGYTHAVTNKAIFVTANQGDIIFSHDGRVEFSNPTIDPASDDFPIAFVSEFLTNPSLPEDVIIEHINLDGLPLPVPPLLPILISSSALNNLKSLSMKDCGLVDAGLLSGLVKERHTLRDLDLSGNPISDREPVITAWAHRGLRF